VLRDTSLGSEKRIKEKKKSVRRIGAEERGGRRTRGSKEGRGAEGWCTELQKKRERKKREEEKC